MNILYTTNEKFVPKVAVSICSVFENNIKFNEINIYILTDYISKNNRDKFKFMAKQYRRKIEIIEVGNIKDYLDFDFDTLGWNPIVLLRLLLDKFLPEDLGRILYLDGDTIVIDSLEKLWVQNLQGCVLGACIEPTIDKKRKESLGMQCIPYVNSGVLLIDLNKWKNEKIGEKILRYYAENNGRLFAPDQDAINGVLKGRIYYLLPKYNFYNIYWFYPYKFLKKLVLPARYFTEAQYKSAISKPCIVHYLGEERPWRKGNHHKFKNEYKKYAALIPWNESEENGWKLYFILWDIFNFFIKPFPMMRYQIINTLIPLFMKWRSRQLVKNNEK